MVLVGGYLIVHPFSLLSMSWHRRNGRGSLACGRRKAGVVGHGATEKHLIPSGRNWNSTTDVDGQSKPGQTWKSTARTEKCKNVNVNIIHHVHGVDYHGRGVGSIFVFFRVVVVY